MTFVTSTISGKKPKPKDIIKSILLFVDDTVAYPKAEILFDDTSILYCDDLEDIA